MLGHQADWNAHSASRFTSAATSPDLKPSSMKSFSDMTASIVLVCGLKPYWFLFMNSVVEMWWFILFIINFSSTFPPKFSKLIGRYFATSLLFYFPGFIIGISLAFFHFVGNIPCFRQLFYIVVMNVGTFLNTWW
jgi:hypothetical protein